MKNIDVFIHEFKNGLKIKLTVDYNKDVPGFESSVRNMSEQPIEVQVEYKVWLNSVVMPNTMNKLSLEQLRNVVKKETEIEKKETEIEKKETEK